MKKTIKRWWWVVLLLVGLGIQHFITPEEPIKNILFFMVAVVVGGCIGGGLAWLHHKNKGETE